MTAKKNPSDETWLVVIRPDAVIEAVLGGAPKTWVGLEAGDAFADVPELLASLPKLIDEAVPGTTVHRVRTLATIEGRATDVELLLTEAVPLRRQSTPIEPLVMRTLDTFVAQARSADVRLDIHFDGSLPDRALIDAEKIAWVLATLVGGALRHLMTGGTARAAAHVDVYASWDGSTDDIVFRVVDNGPGIPEERRKWLFQADPSTGRSAGLALLMARDILVAHRGSISVESKVDEGTTFTLRLPRRVAASRAAT